MTQSKTHLWRTSLKLVGALLLITSFTAFGLVGCESGGIGDPCTPEDEERQNFAGFKLTEENIESRSFQCQTRICLVNHFQGRVSCPQGQPAPIACSPNQGSECAADPGTTCTAAGTLITDCDPTPCDETDNKANCNEPDGSNAKCGGLTCNDEGRFCHCNSGGCPDGYFCDADSNQCSTYVCSKPRAELTEGEQRCYVPGTDQPIAVPVCGECAAESNRDKDNAVYCSCRCGVADGQEEDPNFNFCDCPDGYECEEIRKFIGLGDAQLSGKYCIKQGSAYVDESVCGAVEGWWDAQCKGTPGG